MKIRILMFVILAASMWPRLAAMRRDTVRYDVRDGLSSAIVGGGVQDARGLLWFATWNGLNCYDGYEFHPVRIRPGDGASIPTNHIRDIRLSDEGTILCHTDGDVFEFDLSTFEFRNPDDDRKAAVLPAMGKSWRGLEDAQGCRWTTDRSGGLYKSRRVHYPAHILGGSEGEHPCAFMVDCDGCLWVGTRTHSGINVYEGCDSLIKQIPLATAPYCIYRTHGGDVWIGGKPAALHRLGGESISDVAVYDIKEDARGRLWIATFGNGIGCVEHPDSEIPEISAIFDSGRVRKLIITTSGRLVAATTEGLLIGDISDADLGNIELKRINRDGADATSLSSDATMGVAQDSRGNIYISTESSGLDVTTEESLFSDRPVFEHINSGNSSLPDDVCRAMALASDTLLMIAGNDYVTAYNPETGQSVVFNRNFWGEECQFGEAPPVMLADGTWVFAAEQGVFAATAHNMNTRGYVPPIVFTDVAVNGGAPKFCLVPLGQIDLDASERNISVEFAAIDFVDNTGIRYRTRLDGSPWTAGSMERSVTLFNLPPGTHRLEVQSTDRYGRWVDNVSAIGISVASFWYETWWARLLFVLATVAIVGGVVYTLLYIRKVNRQRRDLLERYLALIKEHEGNVGNHLAMARPMAGQKPEDAAFLGHVRRYVEDNIGNPDANVDDMAMAAAASRSTLNRRLRSQLGISAAQLMIDARMQRAAMLLGERPTNGLSVAEVALQCGYVDVQYFQRVFRKKYGVAPARYSAK